jgi:hypothetical protein
MTVLIPRVRTINVRLSEDEFLAIERFCETSGARSISDLVRTAMHSMVTSSNQKSPPASSLDEYSMHVKDLQQKVETLAAELALLKLGNVPPNVDGSYDRGEASAGLEVPEQEPPTVRDPSSRGVAVGQSPSEGTE